MGEAVTNGGAQTPQQGRVGLPPQMLGMSFLSYTLHAGGTEAGEKFDQMDSVSQQALLNAIAAAVGFGDGVLNFLAQRVKIILPQA